MSHAVFLLLVRILTVLTMPEIQGKDLLGHAKQ